MWCWAPKKEHASPTPRMHSEKWKNKPLQPGTNKNHDSSIWKKSPTRSTKASFVFEGVTHLRGSFWLFETSWPMIVVGGIWVNLVRVRSPGGGCRYRSLDRHSHESWFIIGHYFPPPSLGVASAIYFHHRGHLISNPQKSFYSMLNCSVTGAPPSFYPSFSLNFATYSDYTTSTTNLQHWSDSISIPLWGKKSNPNKFKKQAPHHRKKHSFPHPFCTPPKKKKQPTCSFSIAKSGSFM